MAGRVDVERWDDLKVVPDERTSQPDPRCERNGEPAEIAENTENILYRKSSCGVVFCVPSRREFHCYS